MRGGPGNEGAPEPTRVRLHRHAASFPSPAPCAAGTSRRPRRGHRPVRRALGHSLAASSLHRGVGARSKGAFRTTPGREASVVVLGLLPRRVVLVSPSQPATGAIERIRPGVPTVLADRPTIEGSPGTVRFLAVFCKSALPPETVLKAGQRALAVAQGDPDPVRTLDLGCGEAFASAQISR